VFARFRVLTRKIAVSPRAGVSSRKKRVDTPGASTRVGAVSPRAGVATRKKRVATPGASSRVGGVVRRWGARTGEPLRCASSGGLLGLAASRAQSAHVSRGREGGGHVFAVSLSGGDEKEDAQ
jgi:hypothetical protein